MEISTGMFIESKSQTELKTVFELLFKNILKPLEYGRYSSITIRRTAREGGGYLFNSSLPLPPASQTLRP